MAKKQPVLPKSYAAPPMKAAGRPRTSTAHPGVISVQRAISGKKR